MTVILSSILNDCAGLLVIIQYAVIITIAGECVNVKSSILSDKSVIRLQSVVITTADGCMKGFRDIKN